MFGTKINIDINILAREVRNQEELKKGDLLFRTNAVTNLTWFDENTGFRGTVRDGGTYYSVFLKFSFSGEMRLYKCNCGEYIRYSRACSHIVAAMKWLSVNNKELNDLLDSGNKVTAVCQNGKLTERQSTHKYLADNTANPVKQDTPAKKSESNRITELINLSQKRLERPASVSKPALKAALKAAPAPAPVRLKLNPEVDRLFSRLSQITGNTFAGTNPEAQEIKLVPLYNLHRGYNGVSHSLELSTGISKMYIVKNVMEYANSIFNKRSLIFGKNLEYNPEKMRFDGFSQKIADLIVSVCKDKKYLKSDSYVYYSSSGEYRRLDLPNSKLLEFLEIMEENGQGVQLSINSDPVRNVSIREGNPPLKMKLEKIQGGLRLELNFSQAALEKLDYEGRYILYDFVIYKPNPEYAGIMSAFIHFLNNARGNQIVIPDSEVSRFYSNILPLFEKIAQVEITEEAGSLYSREELEIKVYFDRAEDAKSDGISARVEFLYGDVAIDPFIKQSQNINNQDGKIIIRKEAEEGRSIEILAHAGFMPYKEKYFTLYDEDKIFDFVYEKLEVLKEYADVYYSEAFKALKFRGKSRISAGVRLSADGELLDFSITHDGIDTKELSQLLAAYRLKKKFYRLKNGSYLPLDYSQVVSLAGIVDGLGLSDGELENKIIQLPKFRAMYLDSLVRENASFQIERSTKFKNLVQGITEPQDMEYEVPDNLKGTLRDYQKTGFKWLNALADYGFGGILADDMGLGKTLQILAFLQYRKPGIPSIVVAPTSLVYNWLEEVDKFASAIKAKAVAGTATERQLQIREAEEADLIITSYGSIKRDIELYADKKFAYCFLDEAQHIKNPATLNAQTVKRINARNYFALTGTPIENSLTELWSVFDYLMPGYLFTHGKFTKAYEVPIVKSQDNKALNELGRHIRPFILRRMKKDVLEELPEKTETRVTCTLEDEQKKIYMAYIMEAKKAFETEIGTKGFEKSQIKILSMLTRLRQICCHPSTFIDNYEGGSSKTELFFELLEGALEGGHRVLAFSQFTGMLGILKKELDAQKIGYFYLDGETPAKDRMGMVNAFNKGENKIFLISLKAGGTGLNLVGADTVIHLDPWWNPAVEDQATDRAYRIGQKNPVTVYKLVTKGTIEEKIFELQKKKKELIDSVIKPGESFLTKMTVDEVRKLFELE